MRLVAFSLLVLVACKGGEGDDFYVEPGGGGGTFGMTPGMFPDAPTIDGGGTVAGRVCGLSEILRWNECDQTGLDGLTVMVNTSQATTRMDGTFDLPTPSGSNPTWDVSGNAQMRSLEEFPGDSSIPSIRTSQYQDLAADANVAIDNNVGTIFAQVIYMGQPVANATGSITGSIELVYYDDANGSAKFSVGMTRADGMIWFPNIAPGSAVTFRVTPPTITGCTTCAPKDTTVVVAADAATFATVVFP
jgi:hypothetical protein